MVRQVLPRLADLPTLGGGPQPVPGPLDVHLWQHDHAAPLGAEQIAALLARLSPEEQQRAARLRDDRRRQQFVVGRTLCREVLSRYAPVRPEEWRFALGSRGKPSIAAPILAAPLWFNLSHEDGVSVCAVTGAGPDIGIDIERSALGPDGLDVSEEFFPQGEVTALRLLPEAARGETFVRLWALKESFVKARETSLNDGLSSTEFDLSRLPDISVSFLEPLRENAAEWRFRLFQLDPARVVALAVRSAAQGPLTFWAGPRVEF